LSDDIDFDEFLNLGEFSRSGKPIIYKLQSVVAHKGTLDRGHYIAAVRSFDGTSFCSINDDQPTGRGKGGSVVELQEPRSMSRSFDPYLLFYSKVGLEAEEEVQ
jgi:ubiquitin C-terminal hydrolase